MHPSSVTAESIRQHVLAFLSESQAQFKLGPLELEAGSPLSTHISNIAVTQLGSASQGHITSVPFWEAELHTYLFRLSDMPGETEV